MCISNLRLVRVYVLMLVLTCTLCSPDLDVGISSIITRCILPKLLSLSLEDL